MASVTAFEAKTRFGKLLERVLKGEEVVITKHDKPVARLIPEGRTNLKSICEATSRLRALRNRIAQRTSGDPELTLDEVKAAVDEGRP
jgi:prevent-host-death family protein